MTTLEWILSAALIFIYVALLFTVCALTFRKGYVILGILGIFFPFLWLIGAILPTKRGSSSYTAAMERVNRAAAEAGQSERIEALEQQQAEAIMSPGTTSPIAPPPVPQDRTAQLQQLTELKEKGVLTDSEYEVEKQRILRSS
jgi:hypothetical protein